MPTERGRDFNDVLDYRGRPRVQTVNKGPSKTVQSDAELADIAKMIERVSPQALYEGLEAAQAEFKDVTAFEDYADVQRTLAAANTEFMKLPSKEREQYDHDVAKWLDEAHRPDRPDEPVESPPVEATPVPDTVSGTETSPEGGTE